MDIIAKGQLQHHFWGEYRATIVLKFAQDVLAAQALLLPEFAAWSRHSTVPSVITYHGGGDELNAQEALLVHLGANKRKLMSFAKSIDFGEPFTISVKLTPESTEPEPEQLGLL